MKNPFIAGSWVRGENFFGREKLIEEILHGSQRCFWVAGMRRVGKTSLLKQIEFLTGKPPLHERFFSLFWDFQGSLDLDGFKESLLESLEDIDHRLDGIEAKIEDFEPLSLFEILRALRRKSAARGKTLVLLCDEAEELLNLAKNNPEALPRLRRIFQQGENQITILTATKRLLNLETGASLETSPFLHGFLPPSYISSLEPDAATRLLSAGKFEPGLAGRIFELTAKHPFLLQIICKRIFEGVDFDSVVEQISSDDAVSHFFSVDYENLAEDEQRILTAVAQNRGATVSALEKQTSLRFENLKNRVGRLSRLGYLRVQNDELFAGNAFFERWLMHQTHAEMNMKPPLFPDKQSSRFEILAELGSGGMGRVFKARDSRLDRIIAVKMLTIKNNDEWQKRFLLEARAASRLNHPNIATIFEIGEFESAPAIFMEYVAGETLDKWAKRQKASFQQKLRIALQIADGLTHAHEASVLHRDLKPENIIVTNIEIAKILDFGVAKILDGGGLNLTKTGGTPGTLAYMSPEQASGENVDYRSDIFSFGVLLFELFAGRRPFDGDSPVALALEILHKPAPDLREIDPALPHELNDVLRKTLRKKPGERFETAAAFQKALAGISDSTSSNKFF